MAGQRLIKHRLQLRKDGHGIGLAVEQCLDAHGWPQRRHAWRGFEHGVVRRVGERYRRGAGGEQRVLEGFRIAGAELELEFQEGHGGRWTVGGGRRSESQEVRKSGSREAGKPEGVRIAAMRCEWKDPFRSPAPTTDHQPPTTDHRPPTTLPSHLIPSRLSR